MPNIHHLVHSEPGDGHANEDLVAVRPHPGDGALVLCCLAYGQGGQAGGVSAARPTAFSARPTPGWVLLVVSDGVWKYVGWKSIAQMAARHQERELIDALRRAALAAGGGRLQDDFSVALLYDGTTRVGQNGL